MANLAAASLSFSVALVVIICMAAAFGVLIALYTLCKRKLVRLGGEDGEIIADLQREYQKFLKKARGDKSTAAFSVHREKSERINNIVTNVIFGVLLVFLLAVTVLGFVFKANGRQMFVGKTAYLTVQTDSMEKKHPLNEYYQSLPDNQIEQHALIGIKKVQESELKLYDIVAFSYNGTTYVHRLVRIVDSESGKLYTTAGDNAPGSNPFEIDMPFSRITGVYNGYKNVGLGAFLSYLQSETGTVALVFALCLIAAADVFEILLMNTYKERRRTVFADFAAQGALGAEAAQ